jgi:hypothetical protein
VFAGQAALDTAKTTAAALISTDYTTASWTALTAALALPETTNAEVLTKTTAINDAVSFLIDAEAGAAYTAIMNEVSSLYEIDYTTATWSDLETALALPNTTNAEVLAKTSAIRTAIDDLVADTNTTALTLLLNSQYTDRSSRTTLNLVSTNYSTATWAIYMNALNNAKSVEYNINSLQSSVNSAVALINSSVSGLVFAGQATLNTLKTTAASLVSTDYTTSSWTAFTASMTLINSLPETTNAEVVSKTNTLNDVLGGLVFAGQAALNTAKTKVSYLTETDYIVSTWETLETALALPETTNAQIVTKTTAINNAYSGLTFLSQATLNYYVNLAMTKVKADYTTTSWAVLTKALALPEKTNAEVTSKYLSIKSALSKLIPARPIITVTKYSATKAKITWPKVSGISGYQIYKATTVNGTYTWAKALTGNTYYMTLTPGKTYYFKVRTYKYVNGKIVYGSFSVIKSIRL